MSGLMIKGGLATIPPMPQTRTIKYFDDNP